MPRLRVLWRGKVNWLRLAVILVPFVLFSVIGLTADLLSWLLELLGRAAKRAAEWMIKC